MLLAVERRPPLVLWARPARMAEEHAASAWGCEEPQRAGTAPRKAEVTAAAAGRAPDEASAALHTADVDERAAQATFRDARQLRAPYGGLLRSIIAPLWDLSLAGSADEVLRSTAG